MEKRTFLKLSSALAAGAVLSPLAGCMPKEKKVVLKNWSGNLTYSASNVEYPATVEAVQALVKKLW